MTEYPRRFDTAKRYQGLAYPNTALKAHSYDLNDLGHIQRDQMRRIGNLIAADGQIVDGDIDIKVDNQTGTAQISAARIYLDGLVHDVDAAELTLPTDGSIDVGVKVFTRYVSPDDDPELKGNIALSHSFGRSGAHRLQITVAWAWQSDADSEVSIPDPPGQVSAGGDNFYRIYVVIDGVLVIYEAPPEYSPIRSELERYDREARGHYIVSGWEVSALGLRDDGHQRFMISAGTINVWGAKRDLPFSLPLRVLESPTLQTILSEPHIAPAADPATIAFRNSPAREVIGVRIRKETATTTTRGPAAGGLDTLPDIPVAEIVSITQATTTFVQNTDYVLNGDDVDWSLGGDEPATGSSYDVTYRYYEVVPPDSWTPTTFTVSDAVEGSEILVDYKYALPRTDSIVVNREGQVRYIVGDSVRSRPWPPKVPLQEFKIADVYNDWGNTPRVENVGTRAISNVQVERNHSELQEVRDLVASVMLQFNIRSRQPVTQRDEFVDPLRDDTMRDQGIAQTAAIVDGELRLPVVPTVSYHSLGDAPIFMAFVEEPLIGQPFKTDCERINPYDAFDPMPASLALVPPIDHWIERETQWASPVTRAITSGWGEASASVRSVSTQRLRTATTKAATMRKITVGFTLEGFYPGEHLATVTFAGDEIDVRSTGTPGVAAAASAPAGEALTADADGKIVGFFDVPAGVPAGSVRVQMTGAAESIGNAVYVANGEIETTTLRSVTTIRTRRFSSAWVNEADPGDPSDGGGDSGGGGDGGGGDDPQAQSYVLDQARQMTSVEFFLCVVGDTNNPIVLEDRAMEGGFPAPEIFGQATLPLAGLAANKWHKISYSLPVYNDARDQRAIVLLTDDAYHEIGIARLGGLHNNDDGSQVGVTRQPYQIGVRFSASNNRSWTTHQDSDLTFRINGARYTETIKTVNVGTIAAVNCSDLLVLVPVEEPTTDTRVTVVVTRANGDVIRSQPGQPIEFTEFLNENIEIDLEMAGTEFLSPVVYPHVYVIQGELQASGDYVSRAKIAVREGGEQINHIVSFEANLPSGSSIDVEGGTVDDWNALAPENSEDVGDGWFLQDYSRPDVGTSTTRTRIALSGTPAARPAVRLIRANTTPDPVNIITGA